MHCTSGWLVDGGSGSILGLGVDPEVQCTLQKIWRLISTLNPQYSTLNPPPSTLNTQHDSSYPTTPIFLSAMHRVRSARRKLPPIGLVLSMIVVMSVGTKDRSTNLLMEYGAHSPILRPYTRITNSIIPGIDSIDFRSTLVLRHRFESNETC